MSDKAQRAIHIVIIGLVQGVGFRPFLARISEKLGLRGYVRNIGGSEVEAWIEGPEEKLYDFILSLYTEKPDVAVLEHVFMSIEDPKGFAKFNIERSSENALTRSNIPPDFAVCKECLAEVLNPLDRRNNYYFNSCAYCGPRFSMMYKVPYDRENTSMAKYALCSKCLAEYRDPNNVRRYHAQGISCPVDGPRAYLLNSGFELVEGRNPVAEASKLIDEGYIVAVKGIGGYHIAALATDDDVVLKLRRRKNRPRKPFAIMGLNTEVLKRLVYLNERDEALLNSPQSPILLLPKRPDSIVSKYVSPDLSHEGVFIAYTPLHYLLLMNTRDKFLIMTSGNTTGEPMCTDEECAKSKLSRIADYFLIHDREIVNRVDDSVIRKTGENYVMLRRSRGYAPSWIAIRRDLQGEYIAFGADSSNAGAIGFEDKIVLTQYIGDLDSVSAQKDLLKYIDFFTRNYRIGDHSKPVVVVDMHPRLYSRMLGLEYAKNRSLPWIDVQHHYAHVLGAAIDNELEGNIVGLAIDGVGWGTDGTIWGAEILQFNTDLYGFKRIASILPLPITSDRDAYMPLRLACAYYSIQGVNLDEIQRLLKIDDSGELLEVRYVYTLARQGRYVPASSAGRLIDLVAAILNPHIRRTFEGEPAIWLESIAYKGRLVPVDNYRVVVQDGIHKLDYRGLVDWVLDSKYKLDVPTIARSFLFAFGAALGELIGEVIKGRKVDSVVTSGGAAVNEFIYEGIKSKLLDHGLTPYLPRRIPPGDGGIAFGQVIAASLRIAEQGTQ